MFTNIDKNIHVYIYEQFSKVITKVLQTNKMARCFISFSVWMCTPTSVIDNQLLMTKTKLFSGFFFHV